MVNGGLQRTLEATVGEQGPWWFPVNFKGDEELHRQTGWEEGEAGAVQAVTSAGAQQELANVRSTPEMVQVATMVVPGIMALWAVLGVQSGEQQARWIAIGIVWCIAGDFIQHSGSGEKDEEPHILGVALLPHRGTTSPSSSAPK